MWARILLGSSSELPWLEEGHRNDMAQIMFAAWLQRKSQTRKV